MIRRYFIFIFLVFHVTANAGDSTLLLKKIIRGNLSPKSVVHSGTGLFFAQNMMYRHTISVYDRNYQLVKTISDHVRPKDFGIDTISGVLTGGPVEAAFSHDGKYAWVSNYNMNGDKFKKPGCDGCYDANYDKSFLYRINTESLTIEKIIKVGSVPKYVAVTPDDKYVLVSNWSSGDISIVDTEKEIEIKRIKAGRFPRGITVDSKSQFAYVTIMGSKHIMKISLQDFSTSWIRDVGSGPRHVCISSDDSLLYVSLNNDGKIARINLSDGTILKTNCGGAPRSMVLSPDDNFLYVVNYSVNKVSKIDLKKFEITEQHETKEHPIGITFDEKNKEVWVACYSGSLMVYHDSYYKVEEWYDVFNFNEQISYAVDYLGRISESFFTADNSKDVTETRPEISVRYEEEKNRKKKPVVASVKKKTEISKKTETEKAAVSDPVVTGSVYVIVGSFKVADNAYRLSGNLKAKGYNATTIKSKNGMTYAAIGGFPDEIAARDMLQKIKSAEGMDAWIYKL